ncbi:MAG: ribonuclease Z [Flavobacteriaceae bacterium]|nr:ribonuclease Z [Flavobacteriaceae bacterium]|tara:strand:+ start:15545 stop:15871 length:327 start_codon:yes stop_codon:yes gene_type:complete
MKLEQKNNNLVITIDSTNTLDSPALQTALQEYSEQSVILLISSNELSEKESEFLVNLTKQRKANGTSFVVVTTDITADEAPEGLNIVPTLLEAEDVIQMENIERELGF